MKRASWFLAGVVAGSVCVASFALLAADPSTEDTDASLAARSLDPATLIPTWLPAPYRRGEFLVLLFSPGCPACQRAGPQLGAYVAEESLPQLVGLTSATASHVELFKRELRITFEVAPVQPDVLLRLVGISGMPQLLYVKDGIPLCTWVRTFPTKGELGKAIEASGEHCGL